MQSQNGNTLEKKDRDNAIDEFGICYRELDKDSQNAIDLILTEARKRGNLTEARAKDMLHGLASNPYLFPKFPHMFEMERRRLNVPDSWKLVKVGGKWEYRP